MPADTSIELRPADFDIVDVYRFEGMTYLGDSTVLYTIEAKDGQLVRWLKHMARIQTPSRRRWLGS